MALFAIQLVLVVITSLIVLQAMQAPLGLIVVEDFVIVIHQMFNVIIISVHFFFIFFCFTDDIYLARASRQQ